jgi:hypothetical protein
MVEAGKIQSVESVKGQFEGSLSVSATINAATHDTIESCVFNDGGSGFTTGTAQSAQVIIGSQYLDGAGTSDKLRALGGVFPTDYTIEYETGGMVTYSMDCIYATESDATMPDAANITEPAGGDDAAFHSFTLDIDGVTISDVRSASLSYTNLYSPRPGAEPEYLNATLARPEATLDATAVWDGPDRVLDLAYGSNGATTPAPRLDSVAGEVDVTVNGTQVTTHTLPKLTVDTYDWENIINDGEDDTQESYTFNVDGQVSVA